MTVLVGEHAPTDKPELTPGVASGAAPRGIPVGANTPPEVLIPRGEVAPIPEIGEGVPIPPTCAYAQPEVTTIAVAMARKQRVIAASITDFKIYGQCRAGSLRNCREPIGVLLALRVANAAAVVRQTIN